MAAPSSDAAQAVPQTRDFDIAHEGIVVGHHRIIFRRDGDKLVVHSELKIVEVLFFTAYRYQQTRDEVWRNGKFIVLVSTADDDGTPHDVKGAAGPHAIKVTLGRRRSGRRPAGTLSQLTTGSKQSTPATCGSAG
jgi:hypothetical protein